jgi:hypothetical protein
MAVRLVAVLVAISLLAGGCGVLRRTHVAPTDVATLDRDSGYLKAHMEDGGVYVLSEWETGDGVVTGEGRLLDANRVVVREGVHTVPIDSVALFETNVREIGDASVVLAVMGVVTAGVGVYCATNPKACFGSCPTFYVPAADGEWVLAAEGFSSSIAPALEDSDLDVLLDAHASGRRFTVRLTNEALETHVLRSVELVAASRPPGSRVWPTAEGVLRVARSLRPPSGCRSSDGSECRALLSAADGRERWSRADSTDLARREVVDLTFDRPPAGDVGVVITARQTLLTTFLIYQALAYLGSDAGRWLAALRRAGDGAVQRASGVGRLLGDIEVQVQDPGGGWRSVGGVGETGPLARDTWVVPLPPDSDPSRIRLRLTRGLWRIDRVALAELGAPVEPARLQPIDVVRAGAPDRSARAALVDSARTLVTRPGDVYELVFELPGGADHELLLEARGYYLEWMREEWLAEENPRQAMRLLTDPGGMLRELAPVYSRMEAGMDSVFWGSRYAR